MQELRQASYKEPGSQEAKYARFAVSITEFIAMGLLAVSLPVALVGNRLIGAGGTAALLLTLMTGTMWIALRSLKTHCLPRPTVRLLAGAAPLLTVYVIGAVRQPEVQSLMHLTQLVLVVLFTAGISLLRWSWKHWVPLLWSSALFLGGHFLQWLLTDRSFGFSGTFTHRNALAFAAYSLMYIPLRLRPHIKHNALLQMVNTFTVISVAVLLVVTSSRSSWIAAIASLAVYIAWPFFVQNKFRYFLLLLLTVMAAIGGTAIYMLAVDSSWGIELNDLVVRLTGRRLFSGRDLFWSELVSAIQASPFIGYGAGTLAENFTDYEWSSHNLYLQIMLQAGLVGLVALFTFFTTIWRLLWGGRHHPAVRLTAAFFIGIVLREVFEVSMIQNNLQTGAFTWLIVGAGLSAARLSVQSSRL